jgi:hypothetical protein
MRLVPPLAPFGLLALLAGPALAEPHDPAVAEALFRAGRAAAERGDFATACPKFEESRRLDPTLGTAFNLADCDEHIGKMASAWQLFREVAQRLPPGDERIAIATARAAALEPSLPKLLLRVSTPLPAGTLVVRDGVEIGSAGFELALPVDAGDHVIVVKAPGHVDRQFATRVAGGQTSEVLIEVGPFQPAAPPAAVAVDTADLGGHVSGSSRRTFGFVLLGVGGAAIVTSGVAGAVALSAKKTVDSGCDLEKRCTPAALDAGTRGRTAATISTVAFGVGLAGGVAGMYLLLTKSGDARAAAASTASIGVAVTPNDAFISINGRMW